MTLILAFDATAGRCAVALFHLANDTTVEPLDERVEVMERGHAERLFPMIEASLAAAGKRFAEIDLIAVCTGPGNFTGARIAVAAARGLALSCPAQAVGVDRFEALADGRVGAVCVALEARGGAVHVARFENGALVREAETLLPEEAASFAAGATVIGDAAPRLADHGRALGLLSGDAPLEALARIAATRGPDAPRPAPRYLRPVNAALPRQTPPPILQ